MWSNVKGNHTQRSTNRNSEPSALRAMVVIFIRVGRTPMAKSRNHGERRFSISPRLGENVLAVTLMLSAGSKVGGRATSYRILVHKNPITRQSFRHQEANPSGLGYGGAQDPLRHVDDRKRRGLLDHDSPLRLSVAANRTTIDGEFKSEPPRYRPHRVCVRVR
jgi:hypothetical protein